MRKTFIYISFRFSIQARFRFELRILRRCDPLEMCSYGTPQVYCTLSSQRISQSYSALMALYLQYQIVCMHARTHTRNKRVRQQWRDLRSDTEKHGEA